MTDISQSMPSFNGVQYEFKALSAEEVITSVKESTPLPVEIVSEIRFGKASPIEPRVIKLTPMEFGSTNARKGWTFEALVEDPLGQITQVLCGFEYEPVKPTHWMFCVNESKMLPFVQNYSHWTEKYRKEYFADKLNSIAQVA